MKKMKMPKHTSKAAPTWGMSIQLRTLFVGCLFAFLSSGCANRQQQYPYNNGCYPYGTTGYAATPYAQAPYNAYPYAQQQGGVMPITPAPAIGTPMVPGQVPMQGQQMMYTQPGITNPQPFIGS